ncbi:MAG: type IV secretory system conjugative DNA transfer family protein [Acidobacteria bacterium]|nr:type IV secretory system conjugative DNA transfer family protein [Acidobacteriota bacterium]
MDIILKRLLTTLAIQASKLTHLVSPKHDLHGADFSRFDQLSSLLGSITDPGERLLIGQTTRHETLAVSKTPKRPELGNMLVVARTGGGKGLLAIPQLLTYPHSVIVNDIKGDLADATSGYRSTFSDVFILDPTGRGNRFAPTAGVTDESGLFDIAYDMLHDPRETNPIFSIRAAELNTLLFQAAIAEGYPKFPYVREALIAGPTATAQRLQRLSPVLAGRFLGDTYTQAKSRHFHDTFLLHAFGTLKAKLMPLLTETVVKTLSGSDFTAEDIIAGKKPVTIYLQWPEEQLTTLSPLVRLVMGSLVKGMLKTHRERKGKGCRPVLVLADEAGRTSIPTLADDAATVRSRGIVLWIAVQSLSQLDTIYGEDRAEALLNNMDTTVFYRPNDKKTAAYIADLLGSKSGFARSQQERHGIDPSEGKAEQAVPLMTIQDIMQMEDEKIIVRYRNLPPIHTNVVRMDWRDFPELKERLALPPIAIKPIPEPDRVPVFIAGDNTETDGETPEPYEPVSYDTLGSPPCRTVYESTRKQRQHSRTVDERIE